MDSLRILLTLVTFKNLKCHQVNVNNTFTESVNTETIYITPPDGVRTTKGRVLRILKSLYDLKQAARDWYNYLLESLAKLSFKVISADLYIFVNGKKIIIDT
jgi:Reverse transcriptase (RNA-dependent DNA polymerase)